MTNPPSLLIVTSISLLALSLQLQQAMPSKYTPDADYTHMAAKTPKQATVTGIVVALGRRVNRDEDHCRQLLIVRPTGRGNGRLTNRYLLVPRNYDCNTGDFTNEMFQNKRKWKFPLIRGADCDATFEQVRYVPVVSPGDLRRVPWVNAVPGNSGEKMALTQSLLCYEINGDLKPLK